jgi:prevent-host-death family protein
MRRVSATEASRGFADILDRIERGGEGYVVERRGKDVAAIVPVRRSVGRGATVADLLASLRVAPPPDARFIADVRRIRRSQGRPRDPWASSSTRRT